jgi:hypothetical protein
MKQIQQILLRKENKSHKINRYSIAATLYIGSLAAALTLTVEIYI